MEEKRGASDFLISKKHFMLFDTSLEFARQSDASDVLKDFRDRFIIPTENGKEQVYFLGNSLGLQPKSTLPAIQEVMNEWASFGVEGFFKGRNPWLQYHDQLTKPLGNIVGALPSEIVVMNQLSVNLHLMLVSFYRPTGKRNKILCEAKAFPSDQYMFETHVKHLGFDPEEVVIEVSPREGEFILRTEDIISAIEKNKDELALVLFSGLNYYTGQVFDMPSITKAGQKAGAIVGFDLAHAAGNIPLQLHDWNVDFACWCNYKYLNAGPGAIGGVYIHERYHKDSSIHRFAGWWGYEKETRFQMAKGFQPIQSAEGWQLSTPSLLLYASLKASLAIFEEAGIERLHAKRKALNAYLWQVLKHVNDTAKVPQIKFITPEDELARGCQVSMLMLSNGKAIYDALMEKGFFVDWREPDVIRLAPVPLYNRFEEVWKLGEELKTP